MDNRRRSKDSSADTMELEEIDRRTREIDRERRQLTAQRRLVADRLRKRRQHEGHAA